MSTNQNYSVVSPGVLGKQKTPFEEFLLAEYQNLAQAHFNTINTISEFFKQYILIVSLPISVAVVFLKPNELQTSGILNYLKNHPFILLLFFLLIVGAGLGVLGYVINQRFDALLYARSVNGIRKYFYQSSGLNIEDELRFRVLPTTIHFPSYVEPRHFQFVVLAFAFVDSIYLYIGLDFYFWALDWPLHSYALLWLAVAACFLLHLFVYWALGQHRESAYLRGHIIGVDIDGVLNEHRTHFCSQLAALTGKLIEPDKITQIPVHEIPNTTVTMEDEHLVFNWPEYWTKVSPAPGAAQVTSRLRNMFGYRIWIFTHRPWPQATTFPKDRVNQYWDEWQKHTKWAQYARSRLVRDVEELAARWVRIEPHVTGRLLRNITKKWLHENNIVFDRLFIERGNTDTRDPLGTTRNRFIISQKRKIRLFVEDDLNKALKLANICEIVFLIDQPYNQSAQLPNNVIRMTSWKEIEKFLRRIS